ncbi:MAG: agmatine deiminase family protein [Chitinispirillia bacterium]|nr:agmatine deiminase family protein [Chitinispirillia bacterium]
MKAEYEQHKCTILLYPERRDVWRKGAQLIRETVERLAETIAEFEPVFLGYNGQNIPKLQVADQLKTVDIEYDDIWARDTGGIPVGDDELVIFGFDAWGGLYGSVTKDMSVSGTIAQFCKLKPKKSAIVTEGGNLVSDGNGTLLAVKECLQSRNPLPLEEIENELKRVLNIGRIVWFERGLVYDETGGHVDNLCVLADKNTALLSWTDDKSNPQYSVVKEALEVLEQASDADGKAYKIVKVPIPDIFYRTEEDCDGIELREDSKNRLVGEPIQASYINFAFANGAVIVPQFGLKQDDEALNVFKRTFGTRKVVPFDAREIVLGGGGIHCVSRNV